MSKPQILKGSCDASNGGCRDGENGAKGRQDWGESQRCEGIFLGASQSGSVETVAQAVESDSAVCSMGENPQGLRTVYGVSRPGESWSDRQNGFYELGRLADLVLVASKGLSDKYLALCDWIVKRQMSPKQVSKVLASHGFSPVRISEVKSVCFTSAEIYADFKARLCGWKAALTRIRQGNLSDEEKRKRSIQRVYNQFEKLDLRESDRLSHEGNGRWVAMGLRRDVVKRKIYNFGGGLQVIVRFKKTPAKKETKL